MTVAPRFVHSPLRPFAVVVVALGCGGERGSKIALRFHPPAGVVYTYELEQRNAIKFEKGPMASMPGQAFTMRIYYTQSVAGPTQGGIGVTVKFDSTTVESALMSADAMKPALDRMRGVTSTIVYDDRMNVVRAEFGGGGVAGRPSPITEQMGKHISSMAFPLPQEPVGVGDSWTSETELPVAQVATGGAPLKVRTKLTVKRIEIAAADTTIVLAMETSFPTDPVTVTQQGRTATLRFSGRLTGDQHFSVSRGAPLRSTMGGTMRVNVVVGQVGQAGMTMAMEQQTSLQLTGRK
jgi:hypothetical protein